MSRNSKIEWTDDSWNPIRAFNLKTGRIGWFCTHATTGCEFCYAEKLNLRLGNGVAFKAQERAKVEVYVDEGQQVVGGAGQFALTEPGRRKGILTAPLRWRKPRTIFVCSMTDLFADFVTDAMIGKVFGVMSMAPQHTFIVLTKRAKRMREYLSGLQLGPGCERTYPVSYATSPLPNVWLGVSAERQREADERIPHLIETPAAVRFLSIEPLLGPIDLGAIPNSDAADRHPWLKPLWGIAWKTSDNFREGSPRIDWVIVGGESGPQARPMHPQWARDIRDQCAAAGVPFFFKQWGEFAPVTISKKEWRGAVPVAWPKGRLGAHPWPDHHDTCVVLRRVGKKEAGRLLDGDEYNDTPATRRAAA